MTHKPTDATRSTVSALVAFGVPQNEIGSYMGVSDDTLRKHYAPELTRASVERNAVVASFLYNSASGKTIASGASYSDCLKAAMFWLKTRANWRETDRIEHSGPDGGAVQIEIKRTIVDPAP